MSKSWSFRAAPAPPTVAPAGKLDREASVAPLTSTVDDNDHIACVNAWMELAANRLPPDKLLPVFEHAFGAVWARAHRTLGDVTLTAILDRVLYTASERFPFLSVLDIDETGLKVHRLDGLPADVPPEQVADAVRFVLVEFLTVLGKLTAEILTPALHSELTRTASPQQASDTNDPGDEPPNPASDDERAEA